VVACLCVPDRGGSALASGRYVVVQPAVVPSLSWGTFLVSECGLLDGRTGPASLPAVACHDGARGVCYDSRVAFGSVPDVLGSIFSSCSTCRVRGSVLAVPVICPSSCPRVVFRRSGHVLLVGRATLALLVVLRFWPVHRVSVIGDVCFVGVCGLVFRSSWSRHACCVFVYPSMVLACIHLFRAPAATPPLVTRPRLWPLPVPFGVALRTRHVHMFLCFSHVPHRSPTTRVFSIPALHCSARRNTITTIDS